MPAVIIYNLRKFPDRGRNRYRYRNILIFSKKDFFSKTRRNDIGDSSKLHWDVIIRANTEDDSDADTDPN